MTKGLKIGIDFGATRIKMAIVDDRGRISNRREIDTPSNATRAEIIGSIVSNVREVIQSSHTKKIYIRGVGIGVPGPVDSKKGIVRYFPNIKGWRDVPLRSILQRKLGLKVTLDNDVNAVALGEYTFGAGKGAVNVVSVTLGTGVGGGIIINRQIYRGSTMCAGEIGHIPINETGPVCNCGGLACLERYIGNRYILRRAVKIFGSGITLERLSVLGKRGNKKAIGIWEDLAKKLSTALTGVINLLNPDVIIIGGGLSKAGRLILQPLRQEIMARAMKDQASHVKLLRAKLGDNAGIIGASLLV